MNEKTKAVKYVALERNIGYDWDDYGVWCSFYYDTETKEIVRFTSGHGTNNEPDKYKERKEAVELGIITNEEIVDALLNKFSGVILNTAKNITNLSCESAAYALKCEVNGGRKYKGEAIFTHSFIKRCKFNSYYDKWYAEVVDVANKKGYNVNPAYVVIKTPGEEILDKCKKFILENDKVGMMIHQCAYQASYSSCDSRYFNQNFEALVQIALKTDEPITDYVNEETEEQQRKEAEKKAAYIAEKLKDVTEWANNKFKGIKTDEEIADIIERTMNKYYK